MSNKFKVGDVLVFPGICVSGVFYKSYRALTIELHCGQKYVVKEVEFDGPYGMYYFEDGNYIGLHDTKRLGLITEEIYNSPLYKAMQEQNDK